MTAKKSELPSLSLETELRGPLVAWAPMESATEASWTRLSVVEDGLIEASIGVVEPVDELVDEVERRDERSPSATSASDPTLREDDPRSSSSV